MQFKVPDTLFCLKVGAQSKVETYSINNPFKSKITLSTNSFSVFFSTNICMCKVLFIYVHKRKLTVVQRSDGMARLSHVKEAASTIVGLQWEVRKGSVPCSSQIG